METLTTPLVLHPHEQPREKCGLFTMKEAQENVADSIKVKFKKSKDGDQTLRVAQEWGEDLAWLGGLCLIYILMGDMSWVLPGVALVLILGFYGTGGIQDSLIFTDGGRRITRRVLCLGIPVSTKVYQGGRPVFMMMGTFGHVGGRRCFWWTYRPVLMLDDGRYIAFSRAQKDPVRMQRAVLKAADHLRLPVRTVPQDEEFLPPRVGTINIKTPLPTRNRVDSEDFHQNAYSQGLKRTMLVAGSIGFLLAILFTTQL